MAKNDRDNETVHGKKAKTGMLVSTPRHLVNGKGNSSTGRSDR